MITLQNHIDELRAELRGCLTRRERAKVAAELTAAIAALKEQDRAAEANRPQDEGRQLCARFSMPDGSAAGRRRIASTSVAPANGATVRHRP